MAKIKVLVVDNEPDARIVIHQILNNFHINYPFIDEDFCFEILDAETGELAINIIEAKEIDIILLENKLPGISGINVLNTLKNKNYHALSIMIASNASLELAVKAVNFGAYNFISKPFAIDELKAAIVDVTKKLFLQQISNKINSDCNQNRFHFLSLLSHELKSPINAVEGYLNMIKEKQAGDSVNNYLHMIDRSLERINGMRNLIFDLLDNTRIEEGEKIRNLSNLDLIEVANIAVATIESSAFTKNICIYKEFQSDIIIEADSNEMEIVFNNLLSNAIKYNIEGGKIYFRLLKTNESIKIIVEDTGIGMTEKEIGRLFKDFVRIKNEKTKQISGSGLGLSITEKIVKLYHGKILTESQPNKGTKFTIILPLKI